MISIIVPIYNTSNRLEHCVKSLTAQTYTDIEILLINDGSTDDSAEICDNLAKNDKRIKVFHKENGGVCSARNLGIDMSSGDYIMFADSDDWLELNAVQTLYDNLITNASDISICAFFMDYKYNSEVFKIQETVYAFDSLFKMPESIDGIETILCTIWNKLYKRSVISGIQYPSKIKFGEDFIFNVRVFKNIGSISIVNIPLYHYDCSYQSSAVNKFYIEYDMYIKAMEKELNNLSAHLKINNEFFEHFITERWSYAIQSCFNSNLSLNKKTEVINNWFKSVTSLQLDNLILLNDDCKGIYIAIKNGGNIKTEINKLIIKRKIQSIIIKVKRTVKGMLKK